MSCKLLQFLSLFLITAEVITGQSDKEVLLQLKNFLQKHNQIYRGGYEQWRESDASPCAWRGVWCDASGRVARLDLSNSNISGPAFGNFSSLGALVRLDLSANTITGRLPADINQCRGLQHLNVSHNLLGGALNVSGLANLRQLDASQNRFEGGIAANFPAICANLVVLNVSTNNLSGNIHGLFDSCMALKYVDLSSNQFTGEIWHGLANLTEFSISENNLTGVISPDIFPEGCELQSLDLSGNQFTGSFPNSIANCSKLTSLSLWGNRHTGPIPSGIGEIAGLETLILGNNSFDRRIPAALVDCTKLQFLDVSSNGFGGDVQEIFGKMTSLQFLVLHGNEYTGGIETSGVLRLPELARLDLSYNNFSGELPGAIATMTKLRFLVLAYNNFSGEIPAAYGELAGLQALDLSYNNLSGKIPAAVGRLTSLLWLMMAGNRLSGDIPPELANCTSLLWLNLAGNRLSGRIPPELGSIGSDPEPTFIRNRRNPGVLAGSGECLAMRRWIPESYPPFSFVYSVMTRQYCRAVWGRILNGYGIVPICANSSSPVRTLAISGYVQLSGNLLSGEVPPEIGAMRNLSLLHLDDNQLSGSLPSEIGRLPLVVLNVSGNSFSGNIPSSIGGIRCLESLDLSRNNFSGVLPVSLNQLAELNKFNVSDNPLLSGIVPSTGQLATFDAQSFLGDPLINLSSAASKPPLAPAEGPVIVSHGIPMKVAEYGTFFALMFFVIGGVISSIIIFLRARSPVDQDPNPDLEIFDGVKHKYVAETSRSTSATGCSSSSDGVKVFHLAKTAFTYRDIVMATNNFSEDLVIGRGGYAVVYRGVLPDGRSVAVKKLARLGEGGDRDGEREFRAEMEVLADRIAFNWPHPNLVTLYGWCLSGPAKILVYEYLEGGSLEDVIADWARFGSERRLETAIGIARALVFLHHDCQPAVVHRDVKASNVLLDHEGRAKVTDFGLARVVSPGDSHVSTMVAGTVGYVAPEYGQTWRATTKGDVYSYGVLVMELATGRRAVDGGEECLVEWARRMARAGWRVREEGQKERVLWELLMLGMRCIADVPQERPNMREVFAVLSDIVENKNSYRDYDGDDDTNGAYGSP